jgi:subtilase family serine protease
MALLLSLAMATQMAVSVPRARSSTLSTLRTALMVRTPKSVTKRILTRSAAVTSVGGTMLYADQTVLDAESVMQVDLGGSAANFSSSGGFSNYFAQPSYQKAAVSEYFASHSPSYPYYSALEVDLNTTTGLYNRIGRGYPDVSSNGAYMPAFVNGELGQWFGASLASPTFASILTLVRLNLFLLNQ